MTLLAIDPGKNVGWAVFRDDGSEYTRGVLDLDNGLERALDLRFDFLELWFVPAMYGGYLIDEIVCESYLGRPNQKNGGQRFWGPEALATVRTYAHLAGVPFHLQAPAVLPVAKAHAGYVQTVKHLPDQDSAYLHGFEFLVGRGVLQPVPLDD